MQFLYLCIIKAELSGCFLARFMSPAIGKQYTPDIEEKEFNG